MAWAWDSFCPECSSTMVGGMGIESRDGPMENDMKKYKGSFVHCSYCRILVSFDTNEVVRRNVDWGDICNLYENIHIGG